MSSTPCPVSLYLNPKKMTTQNKGEALPEISEKEKLLFDALDVMLMPYEPSQDVAGAKLFSTNDIIQALELHYGVPQGDTNFYSLVPGQKIVERMKELGFSYANTGGLRLEWVLMPKNK